MKGCLSDLWFHNYADIYAYICIMLYTNKGTAENKISLILHLYIGM